MSDIKAIMEEYGYHCRSYGIYHHDAYEKLPLLKFEIHRTLFFNKTTPVFYRYFKDINNKLIKNENVRYGYHMTNDDLYLFLACHMNKHYFSS